MRTLAVVIALVVAGPLASAAPRPRNEVGVKVASASDTSPGVLTAHVRERHAEIARRALLDALRRTGADVRHAGMPVRQVDVAIVAWRVTPSTNKLDVATEVRVVLCDDHGRMLSIATGRATISAPLVPGRGRDPALIEELRAQALAEAVASITRSLQPQLARADS